MFGAFGFFVQFTLDLLSYMVLTSNVNLKIVNRLKESPTRPWKIWFFVELSYYAGCFETRIFFMCFSFN